MCLRGAGSIQEERKPFYPPEPVCLTGEVCVSQEAMMSGGGSLRLNHLVTREV